MKIRVVSSKAGVEIELSVATNKAPVKHTFTREQLRSILSILETAIKVESFRVEYEAS